MKSFYTFLIISFFVQACNSMNTSPTTLDSLNAGITLKELEQKGLSSKTIVDTIFLGYRFGMTPDQMKEHTIKLKGQGKLKMDYSGKYYFPIQSKIGEDYKGYVFSLYHKNKLMTLGLLFQDEPHPILVFSQLSDLYEKKYGTDDFLDKPIPDENFYRRIWVKNNMKIEIVTAFSNASVRYVDLRYEKQKEIADSLEKADKENEVRKGI